MASILVLADDLTGALEAAAQFAEYRFPVHFTTRPPAAVGDAIIVATTESRHLSPETAAARVVAFAGSGADIIYKKTDSALRGNISEELGALHRAIPDAAISYIPSYPELGRTTRRGEVFIGGIPAHRSEVGLDLLNPVWTSSVAELLGAIPCSIHDGETADDVNRAVAAALSSPGRSILAGPASVSAAIASYFGRARANVRWPSIRNCLIVNGSRHPRSAEQVKCALDRGYLGDGWRLFSLPALTGATASEYAAAMGRAVVETIQRSAPEALIVFGGDTAFSILEAMNQPQLHPIGEVLPGVPVCRIESDGAYFITKAGSFGPCDVILQLKKQLYGT